MTAAPLPDGSLAGYRLVRRLGSGSRADVYLAVSTGGSVALKVFADETTEASIGAELDALGRHESPHLVRLVDLSTSAAGRPIFVLERIPRGSVAALVAGREWLECGEAVTLLAPIATLMGELHDAGLAHGRLSAATVHLGAEGQPVLLGLGHCELFEPNGTMAALDAEPAAVRDREALATMAVGILSRVRAGDRGGRVAELIEWIGAAPRAFEFCSDLADRLFACADPLPVVMARQSDTIAGIPARLALSVPERHSDPEGHPSPEFVRRLDHPLPPWAPSWLAEVLTDSPADVLKRRVLALARGVRPRFWVISGGAVAGLLLALVLIPSSGSPPPRSLAARAAPTVAVSSRTPTAPATPLPDDPLLALTILLKTRATCFRDRSILCLDGVDEASSTAFTADAAAIQRVQAGGEVSTTGPVGGAPLALIERLGDTALLSVGAASVGADSSSADSSGADSSGADSSPASILVIRTKAGWRIRDYLSGVQATASPGDG